MSLLKVVLIGKPNVGKSTLFNKLVGKRHAITDNIPGVTRDWREGKANIAGLNFQAIDTAGYEIAGEKDSDLIKRIVEHNFRIIEKADILFLIVDKKLGITILDKTFADLIRDVNKPKYLIVNKCDDGNLIPDSEFYQLGYGEPICISGEQGLGFGNLYDIISTYSKKEIPEPEQSKKISLAIVGRPNSGKSTLTNAILGFDRMLTGPEAGITRDSISTDFTYNGQDFKLVDTAGVRRRARIHERLEKLSVHDSFRAVEFAHIVALMISSDQGMEAQDITLANRVIEEGRSLIIVINKSDLIEKPKKYQSEFDHFIKHHLSQLQNVPVIYISALKKKNIFKVLDFAAENYLSWNVEIKTSKLNDWLAEVQAYHLPPIIGQNRRIRIKYMTQTNTRPPTFKVFVNKPEKLPASYIRYLENSFSKKFDLGGIPFRLRFIKNYNPYDKEE